MKKVVIALIAAVLICNLMTPSSALFEETISITSGSITAQETDVEPDIPDNFAENLVYVKNQLSIYSGTISIPTSVSNGPVSVTRSTGLLSNTLYVNSWVSIQGAEQITGQILRENVSFPSDGFDFSLVPSNLPWRGDSSFSREAVIQQNGRYMNMNITSTLTIDASKQDIFLVIDNLSVHGNINITGTNRVVIIVNSNLNINGYASINHTTKQDQFDLVIRTSNLNLQNNQYIYGTVYFEGYSLYIRNHITIIGALIAPNAYVELSNSSIYGRLVAKQLTLNQSSKILPRS